MTSPIFVFLLMIGPALAAPYAQASKSRYPLPYADEGERDPEFNAFRERFRQALQRRDGAAIERLSDTDLKGSLTGSVAAGPIHEVLLEVVRLGGSFTTTRGKVNGRREFCAPYTYSTYPKPAPQELSSRRTGELDAWVIIADRAPVREQPDANAPTLASLSRELVEVDGTSVRSGDSKGFWFGVYVGDRKGWVSGDQIRNPEDYHACFAKIDAQWLLVEFDSDYVRR